MYRGHMFEWGVRISTWAIVLIPVAWAVRQPGWLLAKRRSNFTRRTGAYLDPYFADAFDRETRRMLRLMAVLAVVAGVLLEVFLHVDPDPPVGFSVYSPFAAAGLAAFAATRLRSAGREFSVPDSSTAVARPRRVVLGDYVSWPLQAGTWLLVAVDVALAAASVLAGRRGHATGGMLVCGLASLVLTVGMAAFTVWFGRRLCERPTPAVDPSHLYLQDAWRASSLSATYGLVCISAYGALMSLVFVPDLGWLFPALGLMLYPVLGAVAAVWIIQWKWFRRRLWRGLPRGYVLLPGQQPPPLGAGA
jgi:hypothetical protein